MERIQADMERLLIEPQGIEILLFLLTTNGLTMLLIEPQGIEIT